jgi:phosphoglycolate phosphatase
MFDLDGTLVQTRAASWEVFRKVSESFSLGLTSPEEYFALFQGNLFASLEKLCQGRADSAAVKREFLRRLREEYNPALVPGMTDVVRRLAGYCTLAVVSSNATEVLRRVLVGNGIAYCFAHVFGGDVTPDKTTAIRSFLTDASSQYGRRCEVAYDETSDAARPDLGTTVLVTDTAGDVRDACAVGIRAVGVAWGMHNADELTAAGAEFVAIWPQELPGYLLGDGAAAPPAGACAVPALPAPAPSPSPSRAGGCGSGACPGNCRPVTTALAAGAEAAALAAGAEAAALAAGAEAAALAAGVEAAAGVRRERRRQATAALATAGPALAASAGPAAAPSASAETASAELREAVRRIIAPAARR